MICNEASCSVVCHQAGDPGRADLASGGDAASDFDSAASFPNFQEKTMIKFWLASVFALYLTGCHSVNNERFSSHVNTLVQPGVAMDAAVRRLEADGFACSPAGPPPSTTCARTRQALSPSTCIERVNLTVSEKSTTVGRVDIPAIACAGF